jgi:hypothetical protein
MGAEPLPRLVEQHVEVAVARIRAALADSR